jgi:two-component system, cell cycle sensor histidine kinase and response regulator CckA
MNADQLIRLPRRILVIDDNPLIHEDIRKIISSTNRRDELADAAALIFGADSPQEAGRDFVVEMDSAYQGQEGVALLEKSVGEGRPYMLAFVDMRMPPGWDGIETIQRLWKLAPGLQVVICTAYSDRSWYEINHLLGQSANLLILKKPFEIMEVLQLVQTLTQKWILGRLATARMGELESMTEERAYQLVQVREQLKSEAEQGAEVQSAWLAAEERFHAVFEATWAALAVLRADTLEQVTVNVSYLEFLGLTRSEVVGHTLADLGLAGDAKGLGLVLAEFQAGRPVCNLEIVLGSERFGKRPALASLTPMRIGQEAFGLLMLLDARRLRLVV